MLKLIIVDDENMTRNGLVKNIPWEELGIEVVGLASDGIEGWELFNEVKPDIILTDVRMPRMNGIEFAVKVREESSNCHIVFLSGYSDKEYLKTAIKVRAIDYIEKPIDINEIITVMKKTIAIFDDKSIKYTSRKYSRMVEDIIQFIEKNFSKELTIEYISENAYLTPNYMCSLFKKETGKTINQYITEIRIDHAKKLLKETNLRINEISLNVGYSGQRYFSKVFRKTVGINPSEYREQV